MSNSFPAENEARTRLKEDFDKLCVETKLSLTRATVLRNANPLTVPIYHSSTYRFETVGQHNEHNHGDNYVYRRWGNPTCDTVEAQICELEGGAATITYSSGLAAMNAVLLEFLKAGDHLICQFPVYGGTESFINNTLVKFGVEVTWVEVSDNFAKDAEQVIQGNTKMLYAECPCNPMMHFIDLASTFQLSRSRGILAAIDATFASPYLLQPIRYGADFVIHSCTKYIGGHSDLIDGCVTTANVEHWRALKYQQFTTGSAMSPFDASLVTRGLKTLPLRMHRISESTMKIAQFLQSHPKVKTVHYCGLDTDPGHKAAAKVMNQFGGMIAFDVGGAEQAIQVIQAARIITLAVSLGGTESLMEHPISMTHGTELRQSAKHSLPEGLIRLSVGLEDANDLIDDLKQALKQV